jgi:hypothetical protein
MLAELSGAFELSFGELQLRFSANCCSDGVFSSSLILSSSSACFHLSQRLPRRSYLQSSNLSINRKLYLWKLLNYSITAEHPAS